MKIKGNAYSCELTAAPGVRIESELPIPEDTAVYAVKRFIFHSPYLRRVCTGRSYRLRIGDKNKALRRLVFEVPGRLLELPGTSASVTLQIDQTGAAVSCVQLIHSDRCTEFRIVA